MICNLESDGEENLALILCTAFLTRQLQEGDLYCAWSVAILTIDFSALQKNNSRFTLLTRHQNWEAEKASMCRENREYQLILPFVLRHVLSKCLLKYNLIYNLVIVFSLDLW